MSDSPDLMEEHEPKSGPQAPAAMGAARHKFLMLGIILAVIIGGTLVFMNEAAKQENKFQQAMAYQAPPKVKPARTGLPGPTSLVPRAE